MISFLIIVPTLNSYRYLPSLVTSLQQQTFSRWRVQFIDGPSEQVHREYLTKICSQDARFYWENQSKPETGIFGAMNQGISNSDKLYDWILFWGSDDQAASPFVLESIAQKLENYQRLHSLPCIFTCCGIYYHQNENTSAEHVQHFGRKTRFTFRSSFRRSLFLGSTPPHQATVFGPGIFTILPGFSTDLKLSADLDYFLKISSNPDINILREDLDIVWIGDAGISKRETKRRLTEVRIAYTRAFGSLWWIPFILRYLQRIQSIVRKK
jgi:glycosyltransferase involved in cell wall biosynthesis